MPERLTFVRSARSRTASGHARSRDRGNSRSCPKRQRRWISRRQAMLRCRHLRRRPARSFASARLSSPCGRAVVAVIAPPTPLLSFFVTTRPGWRGRRGETGDREVSYAVPQMAALGRTHTARLRPSSTACWHYRLARLGALQPPPCAAAAASAAEILEAPPSGPE